MRLVSIISTLPPTTRSHLPSTRSFSLSCPLPRSPRTTMHAMLQELGLMVASRTEAELESSHRPPGPYPLELSPLLRAPSNGPPANSPDGDEEALPRAVQQRIVDLFLE